MKIGTKIGTKIKINLPIKAHIKYYKEFYNIWTKKTSRYITVEVKSGVTDSFLIELQ